MWLKNRTATCALDSRTPYQALFRRAPNLSALQPWGTMVWVHNTDGTKLDARAHEGRGLSFDTESHVHHVYFAATCNVTTEWNVYFSTAQQLEGERMTMLGTEREQRAMQSTPTTSTSRPLVQPIQTLTLKAQSPSSPPSPLTLLSQSPTTSTQATTKADNETNSRRVTQLTRAQKLSCTLHELLQGVGMTPAQRSDPVLSTRLQLPGGFGEEADNADKAGGVETAKNIFNKHEELDWLEYILATETTEAEALEPRLLAEAKCHPDWPLWEKAITEELATLKTASTWRLEEAPPGANVIGSKWVFKVKKDAASNIAHYKA